MSKEDIYVDTRHLDFWWGIYGLRHECDWEDILIYPDRNSDTQPIAHFCLCARAYLRLGVDDPIEISEEDDYGAKARRFLEGSNLEYYFVYDDPEDADFWEVPYEAPRNEQLVKPSYIELWYPAEGINLKVLRHSVEVFCRQFLHKDDIDVHLRNMMPFEEAIAAFSMWHRNFGRVVVTDDVVDEMAQEMGKKPEEIVKIISRSAKVPVEVKHTGHG